MISSNIQLDSLPGLEIINCTGKIACPGFIDQHVHITGGGGEQGPRSIIDPLQTDMIFMAGITTVVGTLGADGVGKSMEALLMKARSLEMYGLTSFIYSGNYGVPTKTITGRVLSDIALIDKVIGTGEIAISDYRSSYPTMNELAKLAHEAQTGGMLGGKAGVMHMHVGDGRDGLKPLLDLLDKTDFPVSMFIPTHVNRNRVLFNQAARYRDEGGIIDLTAGENTSAGCRVPECLQLLSAGECGLDRVTVSSDGNGSGAGESHAETGSVGALFQDIRTAIMEYGLPFDQVLKTVTENVAKVLKLYPRKGKLAVGSDADILLLDKETYSIDTVIARGNVLVRNGNAVPVQNVV